MQAFYKSRPGALLFSLVLSLILCLSGAISYAATTNKHDSVTDIVTKLKTKLSLDDKQVKEVTSALTELSNTLNSLVTNQQNAGEEEDPHDFIKAVKSAQEKYQGQLKTILTSEQMQSYDALKEQVIMEALDNLAAIKLMDIQDQVGFSDAQMKKLTPVLAESMRGVIKIAWKYAGAHRLRFGEKIRIAREMKEIQHKAEGQVKQILTSDQYKKWEAMKKQAQG